MNEKAQHETPHVGIFWVVQATEDEARLLAAGCPLDQAEAYGDCLTYGPGHYETWDHWRRSRAVGPALCATVLFYEYEDWPRGRIVFDRSRDLFIVYADRKLLTPATIARIETHFHLPAGTHRGPKRLALPEHRDAERARDMIHAALKDG